MGTAPTRPSVLVGKLLRLQRNRLGLTLRQVSEQMAQRGEPFPASTLARVEQGKLDPGVRRLQNLLALYDVSPRLIGELVEIERFSIELPEIDDLKEAMERGLAFWTAGDRARGLAHTIAVLVHETDESMSSRDRHYTLLRFADMAVKVGQRHLGRFVVETVLCERPCRELLPTSLIIASIVWGLFDAHHVARALAKEVIDISADDPKNLARGLHRLACCHRAMGDSAKALEICDRVLAIYRSLPDHEGSILRIRFLITVCLADLGRGEEALRLSEDLIDDAKAANSVELLGSARANRARLFIEFGKPEAGIELLREVLGQAVIHGLKSQEFATHYWLWKAYVAVGDEERAAIERDNAIYHVRYTFDFGEEVEEVRKLIRESHPAGVPA